MPVVPLQCPLCAGLLQIDTALAGQQVVCPLCQGVVALPPAEVFAAMFAPPAAPQMPAADLVQLACPVCNGPFQVPLAMAGQQVGCPHCGSPVMLPPVETPLAASIEEYVPPSIPQAIAERAEIDTADPLSMLPPTIAPEPVGMAKPAAAKTVASERMPPGASPRPSVPSSPKQESPSPVPVSDRLPPGSDRLPPAARPAASPSELLKPEPAVLPSPPPRSPVSERLPPTGPRESIDSPRQEPASPPAPPSKQRVALESVKSELPPSIESLLPPGAEIALPPAAAASAVEAAPAKPKRVIDSLLPPGAPTGDATPAMPGEQVPIPAAPENRPIAAHLPPGMAAVPTPDGGFVTIRETAKTIGEGDNEIELRRLSSEEKSARRFRRNLILCGICLAILFGVLVAMMW